MYGIDLYEDYLAHYGVKGMRWGVRHDRPSSGRQLKNKIQSGKAFVKKRGLTDKQKRLIAIGATAAVGIGVGVYLYKSGSFDRLASIGKNAVQSSNELKDVLLLSAPTTKYVGSAADISKRINSQDMMCNHNSFAASIDTDLDISLKPNAKYEGTMSGLMTKCLKNTDGRLFDSPAIGAKFKDEKALSDFILNKVAKGRDGARGQIGGQLNDGGGHAFNWAVENGKVKYYDTHVRTLSGHISKDDATSHLKRLSGVGGIISRLDGLTIDDFTDEAYEIFNIKRR